MFRDLLDRTVQKDWKTALFLFFLTAIVRFVAVPLDSFEPIFWTMILYVIITLILVKRKYWQEIRLGKPRNITYFLFGLLLIILWFLSVWTLLYLMFEFNPSNWFVVQTGTFLKEPFAITKYNAWQYFPIVVLMACTISPVAEEFFFRGVILKSFEFRFSPFSANFFQAFLFGFIHLTHFGLNPLDPALILTMLPTITLAGLVYGLVVQKTGSVFAGTMVHAFNNFIIFLFIFTFIIPAIG